VLEDLLGPHRDDAGRGQREGLIANETRNVSWARHATQASRAQSLRTNAGSGGELGRRGAVAVAVEEIEDDPLAQAALADLQGLAEQL
jgi:hypothetical protein